MNKHDQRSDMLTWLGEMIGSGTACTEPAETNIINWIWGETRETADENKSERFQIDDRKHTWQQETVENVLLSWSQHFNNWSLGCARSITTCFFCVRWSLSSAHLRDGGSPPSSRSKITQKPKQTQMFVRWVFTLADTSEAAWGSLWECQNCVRRCLCKYMCAYMCVC